MRCVLLLVLLAAVTAAAPISDVFSTGQVASGNIDPNWTVNGNPAYITTTGAFPFPFWSTTTAKWISPSPTYAPQLSDAANTTFVFSTAFTLPADFRASTLVIRAATDNALADVRLNGVSVGFPTASVVLVNNVSGFPVIVNGTGFENGFGPALTISSGFRPGRNTLDLYVRNAATNSANNGNPVGLNASLVGEVTSAVVTLDTPEPSQGLTLGIGVLLLAVLSRSRRRQTSESH